MQHLKTILAAALALGLAACSSETTPDFVGGTPDAAGLTLETSGGAGDGVAVASSALTVESTSAALTPPPANTCADYEFRCNLQYSLRGLNYFVRAALQAVEALVLLPPTEKAADVRVFGPAPLPTAQPVANFRLTVRFGGNNLYQWKLEAQAITPTNDAPWLVVMAGQLTKGDRPHRGRGVIGIDLDQLRAAYSANAAALFPGQGQLFAAFAHVGDAKALVYAVKNFSADAVSQPVDAVFAGYKLADGRARVRLAAYKDFVAPAGGGTSADELLLSRGGYWPTVGGRVAVVVMGGDVASYSDAGFTVDGFLGVECFDAGLNDTFRTIYACGTVVASGARACVEDTGWTGRLAGTCLSGTDLYDPAQGPGSDPNSTSQEPDSPATPDLPPSAMPDASF